MSIQDDLKMAATEIEHMADFGNRANLPMRHALANKLREHAAAMDAARPVGHVDVEPAKGWPDRRIGILHRDVPVGTSLYTHAPPASEVVEAWQPIETAPKDGRFVLLSGMDFGRGPTRWVECGHYTARNAWQQEGMLDGEYLYSPTHWQPLPAPPANLTGANNVSGEQGGGT